MHNAQLKSSPRLRRTLDVLQKADGEMSTMDISRLAVNCAVGTTISELRANGAQIICRQETVDGKRRWFYTLVKSPEGW